VSIIIAYSNTIYERSTGRKELRNFLGKRPQCGNERKRAEEKRADQILGPYEPRILITFYQKSYGVIQPYRLGES